jgi:hypothetical protein
MPRAQFRDTIMLRAPGGYLVIPPSGTTATLYDVGTTTRIGEPIYADASSPTILTNPVSADVNGQINFWLAEERELDLLVQTAGYGTQRLTVTTDSAGGGLAVDSDLRTYVGHVMGVIDPGATPPP